MIQSYFQIPDFKAFETYKLDATFLYAVSKK